MAVILDILKGVNVAVHVGTSLEISLPFQAIPTRKTGAIVLVVSLTAVPIEDQVDDSLILLLSRTVSDDILVSHNAKKKISVIVLTSRNTAIDKNVWKNIREGVYSIVLVLLEIFFQPTSMF